MSTSNNALKVTDLDYFGIRNNLKEFLRNQNEFTDYDFDGSGMAVLLDLLAYNTYYNSFYINMVANETFLDTAQVRQNILSHAKVINYVPTSVRGSLSKVNVLVTPSNNEDQGTNIITLDKYTRLVGEDKDGVSYPFVAVNSNTAAKSGDTFLFPNVFVRQGEVITLQFPVDGTNMKRRFEIPSANVDTSTMIVSVQESASNTHTSVYFLHEDLTEINGKSKVFFLEENENLQYSIYFGDDVIGKRPANGNIVIVTYLDSVGSIANNISNFTFTEPVGGLYTSNVIVTTVQTSYGGTDKESIEQIRFRAPYHYSVQNRAVTDNDYESLIVKDYSNIESVSVWGGEDNDPVQYGKVFMSMKTKGYFALSELEKENIKNSLIQNRNVMTIIPEIVDPEYVYVTLKGSVTYNPTLTTKTASQLLQIVKNAIVQYTVDELNTFKATFKKSKLQFYIENSDPAITASNLEVYLQRQIIIETDVTRNYVIKFNTMLTKGDLTDKLFTFPQIIVNDLSGVTRNVFIEEVPESYTGVDSITILQQGMGYTSIPSVTITGDGSGATAVATVVNGKVEKITITNRGSNYTRATVSITGGGGSGATAYSLVQNDLGNLRTYYYRSNGEKVIVNPNAGTINYLKGEVVITNLSTQGAVLNDYYDQNVLTVSVLPDSDIIPPLRNRILTIDSNNARSLLLEMVAET